MKWALKGNDRKDSGNDASLSVRNRGNVGTRRRRFARKMSNESQNIVNSARIAFSVLANVEVRIDIASSSRSSSPISSDLILRAAFSRLAQRDAIFTLHWKFRALGTELEYLGLERFIYN